jgi:hypothetical protein
MLAKLLSLLIHAKSGAISGVFLLGATGALVSVSASNGVTTITITEASPSPSASANTSPNVTSRTASPSPKPSGSPSLSAVTTPATAACTEEATALAFQVQRVNTAFVGFHTDLEKLRGFRDRGTLAKADGMLRLIRHSATKAIHATATAACKKADDENDVDEDGDNDGEHDNDHQSSPKSMDTAAPATALSFVEEKTNDEDNDDHGRKIGLTFTGDAKAIADQAIAAMQVAFDAAKNAPVTTPKAPTETKAKSPHPSKSPDHKGEHRD